jgi:hypothetical protein
MKRRPVLPRAGHPDRHTAPPRAGLAYASGGLRAPQTPTGVPDAPAGFLRVFATVSVMSVVVAAVAGDKPPRPANASKDGRQSEPVIRPPALIPSSRGRAVASPSPADRHAAEFLRWKEQHASPRR